MQQRTADKNKFIPANTGKPGFFYGYIILLISFVILTLVYGAQFSFGVFFKPVLIEFGWTRAVTAGAYSLNTILAGFTAIFAGRLVDKFGPRLVVTVGGAFAGLAYLLMSSVNSVWEMYLYYGVFAGLGSAGIWVPLMSTVARWFVKKRGLMSGIAVSGIGAGTMIMPLFANFIVTRYNWRASYSIVGAIVLGVCIVMAQFLKHEPSSEDRLVQTKTNTMVKDQGLQTDIRGFRATEAIRTRQFWIISLGLFLSNFTVQAILVHIVPHATDIGISVIAAGTILSFAGGLSIIGRIGLGSAGDRHKNQRVMIVVFLMMPASLIWLLFADQYWMLFIFSAVFSIAYGGLYAVQSPLVAEFFGLKEHGVIFGLANFASNIGGAVGPLLTGYIFDTTGSYFLAFLVFNVLVLVALILVLVLKPVRKASLKLERFT